MLESHVVEDLHVHPHIRVVCFIEEVAFCTKNVRIIAQRLYIKSPRPSYIVHILPIYCERISYGQYDAIKP
jgi:hypothetical protein